MSRLTRNAPLIAVLLGLLGCDAASSDPTADATPAPVTDAAPPPRPDRVCEPPAPRDAQPLPTAPPDARPAPADAALPDAQPADATVPDAALPDATSPLVTDASLAEADCPALADAASADAAAPPRPWNVRRLFSDADGLSAPDGLHRMADGRVLVANQVTGDLQVIDPVANTVSLFFEHFPGLSKPEETADGPGGVVYVSDNVSRAVHRLNPDGTHETVLRPADGLVEPKGLAVRPDGTLVVADEGGRRIVEYPAGAEPVVLVDEASGASSPESLQLAPDGTLYCTDDHAGGVLRIAPDRTVSQFLTPQQVRWADAVSLAPNGELWFSEANPNTGPRLLHYSAAGDLLDTIPVPGPGRMLGVAALADGRVLTAFYQAPYIASEIWVAEPPAP
jgi:streptogramin lyase